MGKVNMSDLNTKDKAAQTSKINQKIETTRSKVSRSRSRVYRDIIT